MVHFPLCLTWWCAKHFTFSTSLRFTSHFRQGRVASVSPSPHPTIKGLLMPLSLKFSPSLEHCRFDCCRPRGSDRCFTPLSCHSYVILGVRVVHCRHSSSRYRAVSAWQSARSFMGSPLCSLTLTINTRAPRSALSLMHSMIVFMMSAFASPLVWSVDRSLQPPHLVQGRLTVAHKYSRSVPGGVDCIVLAVVS